MLSILIISYDFLIVIIIIIKGNKFMAILKRKQSQVSGHNFLLGASFLQIWSFLGSSARIFKCKWVYGCSRCAAHLQSLRRTPAVLTPHTYRRHGFFLQPLLWFSLVNWIEARPHSIVSSRGSTDISRVFPFLLYSPANCWYFNLFWSSFVV